VNVKPVCKRCCESNVQTDDVRWTTGKSLLSTQVVFFPVRGHCPNARQNSCPFEELEETTRMPSYYVAERLLDCVDCGVMFYIPANTV